MIHASESARLRRRMVRAFRTAGAIAPKHARTLSQLGLKDDRYVRRYRNALIIREVGVDAFYLDEDALREHEWTVLRWAVVPIIVMIALLVYVIARNGH